MKALITEKFGRRVLLMTVMLALMVFPVNFSALGKMTSPAQPTGGKIEGTWRVQVTQRNCQTGVEIRRFPAMLTFADGGTLTGTTTAFPVAMRGPDHGVWSYHGDRHYEAVSEAFFFNAAGAWFQTQRITQKIELSPDANSFTSDATVEFFDTAGNTILTGCATALATRME